MRFVSRCKLSYLAPLIGGALLAASPVIAQTPPAPVGTMKICLEADGGKWLTMPSRGLGPMRAAPGTCDTDRQFEVIGFADNHRPKAVSVLEYGKPYAFRSVVERRKLYLMAHPTPGSVVYPRGRILHFSPRNYSIFFLVKPAGASRGAVKDGDTIALRSVGGSRPGMNLHGNLVRMLSRPMPLKLKIASAGAAPPAVSKVPQAPLLATHSALAPAGNVPPKTGGLIYAIQNEQLWAYTHDDTLHWNGKGPIDFGRVHIGSGWGTQFSQIFPGDPGMIYGVLKNGNLLAYVHDKNYKWTVHAHEIDTGWASRFKNIFSGGNGVIYGVTHDGKLLYSKHDKDWKFGVKFKEIGHGWGSQFSTIQGGSDGRIYGLTTDGKLLYYRHDANLKFTVSAREIAKDWRLGGNVTRLLNAGSGVFYINDPDTHLSFARHGALPAGSGEPTWLKPTVMGAAWGSQFTHVFAGRLP